MIIAYIEYAIEIINIQQQYFNRNQHALQSNRIDFNNWLTQQRYDNINEFYDAC